MFNTLRQTYIKYNVIDYGRKEERLASSPGPFPAFQSYTLIKKLGMGPGDEAKDKPLETLGGGGGINFIAS